MLPEAGTHTLVPSAREAAAIGESNNQARGDTWHGRFVGIKP